MAIKATPIIHISQSPIALPEAILGEAFEYVWLDAADASRDMEAKPDERLFDTQHPRLTKPYLNAIFLIDASFPWLLDLDMLGLIPANQTYYQKGLEMSAEAQALLALRGAFAFDLTDTEALALDLRYYAFIGGDGYRSDAVNLRAGSAVTQPVKQFGRVYAEFDLDFGDEWQLLAYPDSGADQSNYIPAFIADRVQLDYNLPSNGVELKLKVNKIDLRTYQIIGSQEAVGDDIQAGIDLVGGPEQGFNAQVLIYARGKGKARIGTIHMRRSRGPHGTFMPNDQRVLNGRLNDDVAYYFDAGDMKPPLNVYFSGWRTKEGYEGNLMMRSMGAPYLLIADQRLQGGAFYLGDATFEREILQVIQEKLAALQFNPHDVILSGMSMGTFGALYYGSQLAPKAIVVGKPLTNVGYIVQNGRVKRPDDFNTGEDIQLYHEGDLTEASSDRLDKRFWDVFNQGDFSDTTLALAYMEQDDYDDKAFERVQKSVKPRFPNVHLLSKGFEGRHNDNTADVVAWFQFQYNKILAEYGRQWR